MQPSEDERIQATLSHASIVANVAGLAGIFSSALIWAFQRNRSRYVHAHALQALSYQLAVMLLGFVLFLIWGMCLLLSLLPAMIRPDLYDVRTLPTSFWLALIGLIIPCSFVAFATLYGLYGAYQTYRGNPFRYPVVSRIVGADLMQVLEPQPKAEAKPEPTAEVKPEAKAEPKQEAEAKLEPKPEPKQEAEAKPEPKQDAASETQPPAAEPAPDKQHTSSDDAE